MQGMENAENHLMQQLQINSMLFLSKQQQSAGPYGGNRPGIPPASPPSNFMPPPTQQIPPAGFLHSRSQPTLFSLESPTPLSPPATYLSDSDSDSISVSVSVDEHEAPASCSTSLLPKNPTAAAATPRDSRPTRKVHRRSQSDVPFAFLPPSLSFQETATPLTDGFLDSAKLSAAGVKAEGGWERGLGTDGPGDDLLNAYMNLQGLDTLTSSEENHENETDSNGKGDGCGLFSIDESKKEKVKGSADPRRATTNSRHCRSLSIDSFMGKFNFEEATDPLPSPGLRLGQSSRVKSLDGDNTFSLEFGSGHFTAAEMKKIMENEKLVEMAMADPKRVKRILANRQSAARSKERKTRHIAELEHKLQSLQSQTSTMSAQLSLLQRNSAGLANQNNELKFRLHAMEQQAQLKDALNDALTAEVQRLKLAATAMSASHSSDNLNQHISIN